MAGLTKSLTRSRVALVILENPIEVIGHGLWSRVPGKQGRVEPTAQRDHEPLFSMRQDLGWQHGKRNFFPGRAFTGLADLNQALRTWVATVADCCIIGATHQRPIDRFEGKAGGLPPSGTDLPTAPRRRLVAYISHAITVHLCDLY